MAKENDEMREPNIYYSPNLFNIIRRYLPLLTGLILEKYKQMENASFQFISSRLTNNYVENNFGNLKKNVFVY